MRRNLHGEMVVEGNSLMRALAKEVAQHLLATHRVADKCSDILIRCLGPDLDLDCHVQALHEIEDLIRPHVERHARLSAAAATDLFGKIAATSFKFLELSFVADEVRLAVLKKLRAERELSETHAEV